MCIQTRADSFPSEARHPSKDSASVGALISKSYGLPAVRIARHTVKGESPSKRWGEVSSPSH